MVLASFFNLNSFQILFSLCQTVVPVECIFYRQYIIFLTFMVPWHSWFRDIHSSVPHNIILIKLTKKIQLCRIIYYSIAPCLLYMFWATLSLIIKSILTVTTDSGFIHMCCCRLLSWLSRNWLSQFVLIHDSSRQQHMWMKPEVVIIVKMLLMMSNNIARNMYSSQGTME